MSRHTAGIVIIGDEVLSARIAEGNLGTLLACFARHGIVTGEVAVLPDVAERITAVVRDFAARFDFVVTTGGVGPTHDDLTWASVAAAFDVPLVLRGDALAWMERRNGGPLTEEQKRMAMLPAQAEIVRSNGGFAIRLDNVWVLPGVPSMVRSRIDAIAQVYATALPWLATARYRVDEWEVVHAIDTVVAAHGDVQIGSYPVFDDPDYRLKLTFVADERALATAALEAATARIGADHLVDVTWQGGELPSATAPTDPQA